jgi:hypothetical protein
MMTGGIVTPSLSDRVFHAGPKGYGWLSAGWGTGAFVSTLYTERLIKLFGSRRATAFSMAVLSACMAIAPVSGFLWLAIATYFVMGSGRGVGGVSMNTSLMEMVPKHLMGRVQNAFNLIATRTSALRGRSCAQYKPRRWLCHHRLRVWAVIRGSHGAGGGGSTGRSCRRLNFFYHGVAETRRIAFFSQSVSCDQRMN